MSDPVEEISKIAKAALQDAYARGWKDCAEAISKAAHGMKSADSEISDNAIAPATNGFMVEIGGPPPPRTNGRPASKAIQVVEDCITQAPGKKGVEVIKAAQLIDANINERTARTCLRRLKMSKKIWQRNGLWYPKLRLQELVEKHVEEASGSPPRH
jgi:hypothetical protein